MELTGAGQMEVNCYFCVVHVSVVSRLGSKVEQPLRVVDVMAPPSSLFLRQMRNTWISKVINDSIRRQQGLRTSMHIGTYR